MASNFDQEDLESKSFAELKREANKLNIDVQPRTNKKELVNLLKNHKKSEERPINPTFISPKLLNTSSRDSQTSSRNSSTTNSPIPQYSSQNRKTVLQQPYKEIQSTDRSSPQKSYGNSLQNRRNNNFSIYEREMSPVAPSSSPKRKNYDSRKQIESIEEYTIKENRHPSPPLNQVITFNLPKQVFYNYYVSFSCAVIYIILFFILICSGIIHPVLLLLLAAIGIVVVVFTFNKRNRMNKLIDTKARHLGHHINLYLQNECNGKTLRSNLLQKFNADMLLMDKAADLLTSKKRINIIDNEGDQTWVLINS